MAFDEALVPPNLLVVGQGISAWGEGVAVYGVARGYRWQHTMPIVMASMYGFDCEEEMADTKQYLLSHGGYQLEQVSEWLQSSPFLFSTAQPTAFPVLRCEWPIAGT